MIIAQPGLHGTVYRGKQINS